MPFSSPNTPAHQTTLWSQSSLSSENVHTAQPDLRFLEHTFRMLPDVVSIYDVDAQQTIYHNRSFGHILGYEDDLSIDDSLLHPDDVANVEAQFQRTLTLNDEEHGEVAYRLKHANGTWRQFSERQVIFKRHNDGRVAQILKTARFDTTVAPVEMENVSADLALEREKSNRLTKFVHNLSHEIRTPLAVIKTSLYLLKKTNDPAKQADRLQIIEYQVTQATRLTEQMTALMKVQNLRDVHADTPIALNKMLAKLEQDYASALAKKELHLELVFADNLPTLNINPDVLLVALENVLENAINFTDAGSIKIETSANDHTVILTVEDTGLGIAAEDLPHIFEPYFAVENKNRRDVVSAGLGLTITQRIMELCGGQIEVQSQLEHGSIFRLIWPLN